MRLDWFFYRQNSSHSPEKFMFNGLNQLYSGCAGVRSRGKALNKILLPVSLYVPTRRRANETARRLEGPEFYSGWKLFFFFSSFVFFLVIVVFFVSLYSLSFLNLIFFSIALFPFLPTSCCSPEVLRGDSRISSYKFEVSRSL